MKKSLLFLVFAFYILASGAQVNHRPKIGLVLSGGGAKGLAHIGILRAIDSAGLKIDYLAGTSMGSIMGAMYAVGYSGRQIDSIAQTLNWDVLLSNRPGFREVSIDEKDEYARYAVELGIKDLKPQLGTGLIESEELWLKFGEVFFPVYEVKDFSKFNIPFRCIATDLGNGKAVVHQNGEIITALRSSMAIPSVFTAIEHGGTKLVDGGIVRNFPVADVKAMGADYVIGVNLFQGLPNTNNINTALDIMYQITQYKDAEDLVKEKNLCNLVIEPPLSGFSAGSFSSADSIRRIGIMEGLMYYPVFKKLADSLNSIYAEQYDPYSRLPHKDSVSIREMEFVGVNRTSRTMLTDRLNIHSGNKYSVLQLTKGFRSAYSTRYYEKVYYTLEPLDSGYAKMKCILSENPMTALKLGLSYHSYSGTAVIASLTERNLLFDKSRSMVKVSVGDYFRGIVQHKQAFGKKLSNYLSVSGSFESLPLPIYEKSVQKFLYRINFSSVDLNYRILTSTLSGLAAGISLFRYGFQPDIASEGTFSGNVRNYFAYLQYEYNSLNKRFFPTEGVEIQIETGNMFGRRSNVDFKTNGLKADYSDSISGKSLQKFKLTALGCTPLSKRVTLLRNLNVFVQRNYTGFLLDNIFLGGIQPVFRSQFVFPGLKEGQLSSSSFAGVNLGLQYRVSGELYLIPRVSGGIYNFSYGKEIWIKGREKYITGASVSLGYNLSALPMEFTLMYSPEIAVLYGHVRMGFLF